ncbi:hypothetical protein Cch01nite_41210 [Cellulomonas chitinilytica]|uniref:Rho termination factor-like N-terminal domain-containing protein n=1 Tax=Cellulomonas chitinilytica TaxID=398759 RepID=A0A919P4T9_9CELL|nr:hypothetical protein Cch01nite_41210 [Cellulomonas chitinilytica]
MRHWRRRLENAHVTPVERTSSSRCLLRQYLAPLAEHTHEKVGDRWRPKAEWGPSDKRAEEGPGSTKPTAGGVDASASKAHLYGIARELDVDGRSRMSKDELVEAIQKENDRRSRQHGPDRPSRGECTRRRAGDRVLRSVSPRAAAPPRGRAGAAR